MAWRPTAVSGVWESSGGNGVQACVVKVGDSRYAWNVKRHNRTLASGYSRTLREAEDVSGDRLVAEERRFTDSDDDKPRQRGSEHEVDSYTRRNGERVKRHFAKNPRRHR